MHHDHVKRFQASLSDHEHADNARKVLAVAGKHTDAQARTDAMIDELSDQLRALKGRSIEEVIARVQHVAGNLDALKALATEGVPAELQTA